jgi:RNA polymerase sigma-70 factor (ECF subfamily)
MSKNKSGHQIGEFATRHKAWLLAQARIMCRNAADAEDLVQEAILRFMLSFDSVELQPDERPYEEWLLVTLTHLFYDQCRKRQAQAQGAMDPVLNNKAVVVQEPPSLSVYDTITDEQFAEALRALSPHLRHTFEMRAAGMRIQDIARSIGISVGTVAMRLHDARTKLRRLLDQSNSGGD